jgi:hypothetical protein
VLEVLGLVDVKASHLMLISWLFAHQMVALSNKCTVFLDIRFFQYN